MSLNFVGLVVLGAGIVALGLGINGSYKSLFSAVTSGASLGGLNAKTAGSVGSSPSNLKAPNGQRVG